MRKLFLVPLVFFATATNAWAETWTPVFPNFRPIVYPADNPSLGTGAGLLQECLSEADPLAPGGRTIHCTSGGGVTVESWEEVPVVGNVAVAGGRQYCYDGSGPVCFPVRATFTYPDGRQVPLRIGVSDGGSFLEGMQLAEANGGANRDVEQGGLAWLEGHGTIQALCAWSLAQNGPQVYPPAHVSIGIRDPSNRDHVWQYTTRFVGFMPACESAWLQECGQYNCVPYPGGGCPVVVPVYDGLPGHCVGPNPPCPNNELCPPARPSIVSVSAESGAAPLEVTASVPPPTNSPAEYGYYDYYFDFGDGSPVVGPQDSPTATHTYTEPGTYTVWVVGPFTEFGTATAKVTVDATPPDSTSTDSTELATGAALVRTVSARVVTRVAVRRSRFAWGQLWRARDVVTVMRNGRVIVRVRLGIRPPGYNAWVWRHTTLRRGRYAVKVCGRGGGYGVCKVVKRFRRR